LIDSGRVTWETVDGIISKDRLGNLTPGLFWDDGYGYFHKAVMFALMTVASYPKYASKPRDMAELCWTYIENSSTHSSFTMEDWIASRAAQGLIQLQPGSACTDSYYSYHPMCAFSRLMLSRLNLCHI